MARLSSANDYYLARANALENNVRFYRVVLGKRQQLDAASFVLLWVLGSKAESDSLHRRFCLFN